MKHLYLPIALGATLFVSSNVYAGSDSGLYIGGSLGSASVDYLESDTEFGDINFDESDTGFKLFAGFNFGLVPMLNLAAELAYVDFGSQEGEINEITGNEISVNAYTGTGLVGFDTGPIGWFGKMGFASWESDLEAAVGDISDSESGTDPVYGLGAKIQLGSIAIRGEYEMFDLDDVDIDYFSVGAVLTF